MSKKACSIQAASTKIRKGKNLAEFDPGLSNSCVVFLRDKFSGFLMFL